MREPPAPPPPTTSTCAVTLEGLVREKLVVPVLENVYTWYPVGVVSAPPLATGGGIYCKIPLDANCEVPTDVVTFRVK
jgi:hypothetical protein